MSLRCLFAALFLLLNFTPCSATLSSQDRVDIHKILSFWFGDISQPDYYPLEQVKLWFTKNPDFDKTIETRFGYKIEEAARGQLQHWEETPKGRLALVILLDQFTRNIYRNRSQAFSYDKMSQKIVLEGIEKGDDLALSPIERAVFYLPLEHAEDVLLQDLSVKKFKSLAAACPKHHKTQFDSFLDYAIRHRYIIVRFGRFPHRNTLLKRESTDEEISFLKRPGSSF